MNIEISTELIKQDLENYFEYGAHTISEIGGGTVGYTYNIDDKYFFKIYDTRLAITYRCTEHLQNQLTVLDILHTQTELEDRICYPIKTLSGEYFFTHDNIIGVLFSLINGKVIGFENKYSKNDIAQLSNIVKTLHSIDTTPFTTLCPKEDFCLDFLNELEVIIKTKTRELPGEFCELIARFSNVIIEKISHTKSLAQRIKNENLPFVLCHTDIHGGNIMKDSSEKLYLVDWENVILSPKEADLFTFADTDYFPMFCNETSADAIAYYKIRRDFEDIWEFLRSLLRKEFDKEKQAEVYCHLTRILKHLSDI